MPGLSVESQEEILREIAQELIEGLRPGWSQAILRWSGVVGGGAMAALRVRDAEGRDRGDDLPDGVSALCGRLKNGMYRPGRGTWFTMTFTLSAAGTYTTGFDYDGDPAVAGFRPEHYAKEVAHFPRDPEHVPDWLKAVLDQVPNLYAAVYAEPGERYEDEVGPHLGEMARAFEHEGWQVGPGEFHGERRFSTEWARLETLSQYGLIRLAGTLDPGSWDDLVAFFTRQDWNFGASLYEGEEVVANVDPRPPSMP
jgi:hypothetical protein